MTERHPDHERIRLDQLLMIRGLVQTRSRARDLILRGKVHVGQKTALKPSQMLRLDADISIDLEEVHYVSRGALKLIGALDHFGFSAAGASALDVGASTGGFTQVLIERGAADVLAVDVGRGQLAPEVADDPLVVSLEKTDARDLSEVEVDCGGRTAIVCDVSFISVLKVLPHIMPLAANGAWMIVLVKPQFEVGRQSVGKGGIVRDKDKHQESVKTVADFISTQTGWTVMGHIPSPISGADGNQEYLVGATYG